MLFRNTWKLYEWINKNPKRAIVSMAMALDWSCDKVERHLTKLVKDGLVKLEINYTDHLYYSTPVSELIKNEGNL